jgi:hypothetical protein
MMIEKNPFERLPYLLQVLIGLVAVPLAVIAGLVAVSFVFSLFITVLSFLF